MKKMFLKALSLVFLLVCFQVLVNAQAPTVTITGPTSCVGSSSNITYTGSHNFCSSNCTVYTWEVTGGQFIIGGVPSSCPLLTIAESQCGLNSDECTGIRSPICGMPITVRWNAGITSGSLRLSVTENILLTRATTIFVSLGSITGASQTSFNCSSATYAATAIFPTTCSIPATIRWNKQNPNGTFTFVGTGATLTDSPNFNDVTYRIDLVSGTTILHSLTRTFPGKRPQSILGPSTMGRNETATFTLNAPALTTTWSVGSSCSAVQYSTPSYADVRNTNCAPSTYISVNASGTWTCGTFATSKGVIVASYIAPPINQDGDDQKSEVVADKDELELEERSDAAAESLPKPFDVVFYPVPVKNGQLNGNVLGKFESGLLRILDLTGREVMSAGVLGNTFQVDLPNVQAGIYIAQVSTENGVVTQKILLED